MLERVNGWMTAEQLLGRMFDVELGFMRSQAKDPGTLGAAYHPQVVVHEPASLPYAGDWQGLDGVATLLRMMGQLWSEFRLDHLETMRRGDTVFLSGTLHLQGRATGVAIDQPFAEVLHFKDDLLLDATPFYYDTGAVLSVLR